MNLIYKLSDMHFARNVVRGTFLAAAVIAVFASTYNPVHAQAATTTSATSTPATNTPPVILLNGDATTTIFINTNYSDLGATATDTEEGDLTSSIVMTGTVATTSVGTSTLTFTVTDAGGLFASTMREVVVIDNIATTSTSTSATTTPSTSGSGGTSTSTPTTGSITFCHIVWNGNTSAFASTSAGLPDGTFTLYSNYAGPLSTSTGSTSLSFSPISFSAAGLNVDTAVFGTENNAECVTESGLDFGYYRYSEQALTGTTSTSTDLQWKATLYNDQYDISVQSLNDFYTYSTTTNENSDGIISIGENRPDRTLVILDSFGSSSPTVTPGNGGNSGGSSGGNGSSNGGSNNGGSSSSGGGSSHRSSNSSSNSSNNAIGGNPEEGMSCSYLTDYLKIDWNNNPTEVKKLQIFLNIFEQSTLDVNGIFDQQTYNEVKIFQQKYAADILTPWGYAPNEPTGFVYLLTKKKINELVCGSMIALTQDQENEISLFKDFITRLKNEGISAPTSNTGTSGNTGTSVTPSTSGTGVTGPTGTLNGSTTASSTASSTGLSKGTFANLASAIFSIPQTGTELTRCIFNLIIILAIIYIITSILVNNDEAGEAALLRSRIRKLWFYLAGVIIAMAFALFFDMFCLVAPLLLILIILAIVLIAKRMRSNDSSGMPPMAGPGRPPHIVEKPEPKVETPVNENPISTPAPTPQPTETTSV